MAVVDQIRAIAKERLKERIGTLSGDEMAAIARGLQQILELICPYGRIPFCTIHGCISTASRPAWTAGSASAHALHSSSELPR